MGLRTSLYIPNQDTLNSIQDQAQQKRWSISKYLIWLHDKYVEGVDLPVETIDEMLDRATEEGYRELEKKLKAAGASDPFFKPAPKPGKKK